VLISELLSRVRVSFIYRFGPNSFIGSVQIGPQVMDEQGQRQWVEMIQSPYQAVSRWHPIFSEEGRRKIAMIKT